MGNYITFMLPYISRNLCS